MPTSHSSIEIPERTIPVGYQGEAGAYSQRAVKRLFTQATSVPFHSVHRVFEAVEIGTVAFGVVPLENSHAGSINESYDLLVRHGVSIVGETIVRISHCLLALPGTPLDEVRTVYSHNDEMAQLLSSGEIWIGDSDDGSYRQAKAKGLPIELAYPEEGMTAWYDGPCLVANAPHPEAAYAFINYMLSPEVQAQLPKELGYAPANSKAISMLDSETKREEEGGGGGRA